MLCTYSLWPDAPFIPCSNFRFIQGGQFDCEGKCVCYPLELEPAPRAESRSRNLLRSTGEDRIGRKPCLYRGRGNSVLTQSPERFGP
jgi:hypothetical protein